MNRRVGVLCLAAVSAAALLSAFGCSQFASRSRAGKPSVEADGIRFVYYAPAATRVQLAGNWPGNNWARGDGSVGEADVGLMTSDKDGTWEITVSLGPGRYQYLFWVDENTWQLDPANPEEVDGGPAGIASQLLVVKRDGKLEIR